MKKLLVFLIMLVVGMALFAVPLPVTDVTITLNTVEAAPQIAGAFPIVTDVSPAIALAEYQSINISFFEVTALTMNTFSVAQDNSPFRQEVIPLLGYSKTADQKVFDNLRLTLKGWT